MKILFVSDNYPPHAQGGAEISTSLLAEWLAKTNDVKVLCSDIAPARWDQNGIPVYPILRRPNVGVKNTRAAIKYALDIVVAPFTSAMRVVRFIKEFDPDVVNVVVTLYHFMPLILLVKLFTRKPVFVDCREYSLICPIHFKDDEINDPKRSSHGFTCLLRGYRVDHRFLRMFLAPFAEYESFVFNIYKASLRAVINHSRGITLVSLSRYVENQLVLNGFRRDRIVVIHNISKNSHDTGSAPVAKDPIPTFVYAGRIEKEKGVWDLVAAVELLRARTAIPFRVNIAGVGTDYDALRRYCEGDASLPVTLFGRVTPSEVLALYKRSIAIVAPSRWPEPFGRFIQESMSTATPVIATAAGGVPEGVKDGVTGMLFDVGDVEQLAKAMEYFLEHPGASYAMGAAMAAEQGCYDAGVIGPERLALYKGRFDRPLRILHVTSIGYAYGGAAAIVRLLRDESMKRGDEVRVLASNLTGDGMFSDYQLPLIPKRSPVKALYHLFYLRSYSMMRAIIKEFRPDIIHFHNVDAFTPSAFFAVGRTPALMTVHGPEEFTEKLLPWVLLPSDFKKNLFDLNDLTLTGRMRYFYYRFMQRPIYRLGLRNVRAFVAPSRFMAEAIRDDVPPSKIRQIYNGIHLPMFVPPPHGHRVLYVGRLDAVKGVETLLRAFASVARTLPDAELEIVGDGPLREDLERLSRELGLEKRIVFSGWVAASDVLVRKYAAADVVVIPSVWPENLPTVCVEALAVGRPVVGTATGGIPELIEDGVTGLIVPVKNAAAITAAIDALFSDPAKLDVIGRAASVSARRFAAPQFVDHMQALYNELTRTSSRPNG